MFQYLCYYVCYLSSARKIDKLRDQLKQSIVRCVANIANIVGRGRGGRLGEAERFKNARIFHMHFDLTLFH